MPCNEFRFIKHTEHYNFLHCYRRVCVVDACFFVACDIFITTNDGFSKKIVFLWFHVRNKIDSNYCYRLSSLEFLFFMRGFCLAIKYYDFF